jgi:ATP/maltotriose-dependent transcriptional regulator MalT/DNA-binding SARP family transcriptional activator
MVELPHKIYTPQRPPELVLRPRLIETLQKIAQRKLIALVAPAGYGKTSLLIDLAHMTTLPLCWYTLDVYDSDPWSFLLYLTAAVEHRFPGSVIRTLQLLQGEGHQFSAVVEGFIHELNAIQSDFVICLDDWHLVDKVPPISDLIATILSRCPNSHIILASRSHPSLPNQMLLAARRQFVSMNETQLRFSADELAAVIAVEGITNFTPDHTEWLVAQSDGWLTGILLALQTTNGDIAAIVANRTVMSRPAHHFLAEQVLDQQPPEIQQFLIESSMLEELTVERCNTLLERSDSWSMLEYLLAHRLFITEIAPGVLRQHPLFRELLQHRLRFAQPTRFRSLSLRVAADFARQGQWSSAFDLCISVADLACARRILNDGGEHLYMRGHLETLERAFSSLSADVLDLSLLCLKAQVALDRRQIDQARHLAEQAALCAIGTAHPRVTLLEAAIDQSYGRFESARARCLEILETTNDPSIKGAALRKLGISLHRMGQPTEAIARLKHACEVEQARGSTATAALALHELGICYQAHGDLRAAEVAIRQAETYWSALDNTGRRALTRNCLALNHVAMGRYHDAFTTASLALRDAQDAAIPPYEAAVLLTLGNIYADLGLWNTATTVYQSALKANGTALIVGQVALAQIRLLIQKQQYHRAAQSLNQWSPASIQEHQAAVLLLRAHIAGGTGDPSAGLAFAEQALNLYATADVRLDQARAWMIQAWLHSLMHTPDDRAILTALHHAADLCDQIGSDHVAIINARMMVPCLLQLQPRFPRIQTWLQQADQLLQVAEALERAPLPSMRAHDDPSTTPPDQPSMTIRSQPEHQPALRAHYLGGDRVWIDDKSITLGLGRARELLAYLITHPEGASRTDLYRAIWCTDEPPDDPNALNRVIYRLRAALPPGAIMTINRDTYCLDRAVLRVEVDAEYFERLLDTSTAEQNQMQTIVKALDVYRGVFLPSVQTSWSCDMRTRLELRYREALRQAAERNEETGSFAKALDLFRQLVARDTTNIAAHSGIMRCHIALQWPALAIEQYRTLRHTLDTELGIGLDPSSEAERMYRMLLAN